jgi:uncharacterized protein
MEKSNWYDAQGLHFTCTKCSACCRFDPGYVFLSQNDLNRLTEALGMKEEDFISSYCMKVSIRGFKRLSLKEKNNFDCIFWQNGGCSVYEFRPFQCRSYPFWPAFLESPESWNNLNKSCPGVNRGELHRSKKIRKWLKKRMEEPFILL